MSDKLTGRYRQAIATRLEVLVENLVSNWAYMAMASLAAGRWMPIFRMWSEDGWRCGPRCRLWRPAQRKKS